jgi:hypothetical protein
MSYWSLRLSLQSKTLRVKADSGEYAFTVAEEAARTIKLIDQSD